MPMSVDEREIFIEFDKEEELHLVSDGPAKENDRSTFAICLSSTDMTAFHPFSHKCCGTYHDSG